MAKHTCIKLKTVDQRLTIVQQPILSSGDVGTVRVEYELDSFWGGYVPCGTFYTGKSPEKIYEQPLTAGACVIPWEVLEEDGILYIGLRGVDGAGLVKTAAPVRYRVEKGSPRGTDTTTEPTPDVYQQILEKADSAVKVAQSVREDADSGALYGPAVYISATQPNAKNCIWVNTSRVPPTEEEMLLSLTGNPDDGVVAEVNGVHHGVGNLIEDDDASTKEYDYTLI